MSGSHPLPAIANTGAARPLRAPAFWLALLLLVVNDHLLKGAGVVPSWLTGKLSDFAGLVVAPVVAAELCRGRLRPLRTLAACAVVVLFVATELFAPAARGVELLLGALGLSWHLWPDPSDLLALAVLPLTFRLLGLRAVPGALPSGERLALALACAACLATSDVEEFGFHPFLVNHSGGSLELRLRFYPNVSCDRPLAALAAELEAGPQPVDRALLLQPTEVAALDEEPTTATTDTSPCGAWRYGDEFDDAGFQRPTPCIAVRLEGVGVAPHLMRALRRWTHDDARSQCAPTIPVYEDPGEGALVVAHGSSNTRRLVAHRRVELVALP